MNDDISAFSTFVMSETTLNQIRVLPPQAQLEFFWAVANYGVDGIEPDFSDYELAIWIPMRDLILHSKRKDEKWREKQKENGRMGGRPKTQNNPDKPTQTQNNPEDVWDNFESHNDNDNENGNDNEESGGSTAPLLFESQQTALELSELLLTSHRKEFPDYLSGKDDKKTVK
jgi:hypothetical protein